MLPDGAKTRGARRTSGSFDAALGLRVRELRRRRKLSQTELARQLDVTFQQVQKYECGANRISVSTLLLVARALKVPLDVLIMGKVSSTAGEDSGLPDGNSAELFADGIQLMEMFDTIGDTAMRARILDLVEMLCAASRRA